MDRAISFPARFCGPPDSANGGYTAGSLASYLTGTAEVTLRRPPPLDRPLHVAQDAERATLHDGDDLIAEATSTSLDLELVPPVSIDTALAASEKSPFLDLARHPFPTCFTCGPLRDEGDGLRVFAGPVAGTEAFACVWTPSDIDDRIVWAALDCPSCAPIYLDADHPSPHVLGRIAARVDRLPAVGIPHVIMSWSLGRDGRKQHSASAIYAEDGACCAAARATWIRLAP